MKKKILADLMLLLLFLTLGAGLFFLLRGEEQGAYVEVERNGRYVTVLSLKKNAVHELQGENGITLTVRIEDGAATVTHATCRDKLCTRMGRLERSGDVAVCLPARVTLRVLGESEVDAYV